MNRFRYVLVPLFTFAAVFIIMLLPQKLSQLQDSRYSGQVHSEVFSDQNNLPTHPLDFFQRIELFSHFESAPDVISVQQELSENYLNETLKSVFCSELSNLITGGVLPNNIIPDDFSCLNGSRLYLQYQNLSAEYIIIDYQDKLGNTYIHLIVDEETGHAIKLSIAHPLLQKHNKLFPPSEIGALFLHSVGIENFGISASSYDALLSIEGQGFSYSVFADSQLLKIFPVPLQGALDTDA